MHLLLIGVGGFIGSVLRYLVGTQFSGVLVPGGTFVVNIVGCFCMGLATAFGDTRGWPSRETHLLVTTGLLGGFTTFSAFGQEAITLLRVDPMKGTFYSVVHVVLGIAAVGAGRALYGLALRP
jgi:CrcB protein